MDRGKPAGSRSGQLSAALTSPSRVRELLGRHGLSPDRSFGQNFLVDASVLDAIIAAAELDGDETVVEFGPGLGALTVALAGSAGKVRAVELDERLLPVLAETTAGHANVTVVHQDALRFDYASLEPDSMLVANLPYNVATPLIRNSLESDRISRLVVMVQKEVADRLRADVGDSGYSALSLFTAHYADVRLVRHVQPGSFLPPPKVTSSVVRLDRRPGVQADPGLFRLIRSAFAHRRKTLRKNLIMSGYPEGTVLSALDTLQLDHLVRAEQVSPDGFRRLAAALQRPD